MESSILVLIVVVFAAALVAAWGARRFAVIASAAGSGPSTTGRWRTPTVAATLKGSCAIGSKRTVRWSCTRSTPTWRLRTPSLDRHPGAFVDTPEQACADAERLLEQVLRLRGYPVDEDFDTQADLVSVDHPNLTVEYRRAHEAMRRHRGTRASPRGAGVHS